MKNVMDFDGYQAAIAYDPEMEMFRGEFVGLNGGADFYASDLAGFRSAKPSKRRAAQPLNDTLANNVAQFHIGKMRDDERKSAKEQLREERHDEEEGNFVHLGGIGLRERAFPRQK